MTADPETTAPRDGTRLASTVFADYGDALQRFLMRRLRRAEDIGDLEQEVYLRLLRIQDAELVRNPQAYMYRVASHVVYEFRQRARHEPVTFDSEALAEQERCAPEASADRLAEELHAERQVDRLLKRLPPRWRAMFILHVRDGLTHSEVAEKLQISVHTVKKQMYLAFIALRRDTP